jgi:hypothetical protein
MLLPPKKAPVVIGPSRVSQKNLEHLYARRSAIDALIQSLEEYERFRAKRAEDDKLKTA